MAKKKGGPAAADRRLGTRLKPRPFRTRALRDFPEGSPMRFRRSGDMGEGNAMVYRVESSGKMGEGSAMLFRIERSGDPASGTPAASLSLSLSLSLVAAGDINVRSGPPSPPPGSLCTDWGLLPQELLDKVLRRLPMVSQRRFRSVSKLWLAILTCPSFLRKCGPRVPALLALCEEEPGPRPQRRAWPHLGPHEGACAADAGLVCFLSRTLQGLGFCMLNPMTGAWRQLPGMPRGVPSMASVALLADRVSKAYTLVVTDCNPGRGFSLDVYQAGAGADGWEEAGRAPQRLRPDPPAFCPGRGLLYFLASDWGLVAWSVEAREFQARGLHVPPPAGVESARLLSHRGHLLLVAVLIGSLSDYGIWRLEGGGWEQAALLSTASFDELFPRCGSRDHNSWSVLSLENSVCLNVWFYDLRKFPIVDHLGRRLLLAFDCFVAEWFVMPLQYDTPETMRRASLLSFDPSFDSVV